MLRFKNTNTLDTVHAVFTRIRTIIVQAESSLVVDGDE